MKSLIKTLVIKIFLLLNIFLFSFLYSESHNIYEIMEQLQKDIKTLEKAVYSGSIINDNSDVTNFNSDNNSEDVLTRHLLKLSEIENQFQQLTNRFEEINFKLDKLSNRLSKVQADNQIRFHDLEDTLFSGLAEKKLAKNQKIMKQNLPQFLTTNLGSISYKDTATNETQQQTQSIDITVTIVKKHSKLKSRFQKNSPENRNLQQAFKRRLFNSRKSF